MNVLVVNWRQSRTCIGGAATNTYCYIIGCSQASNGPTVLINTLRAKIIFLLKLVHSFLITIIRNLYKITTIKLYNIYMTCNINKLHVLSKKT